MNDSMFFARWHAYPEEKPTKSKEYLIHLEVDGRNLENNFFVLRYQCDLNQFSAFEYSPYRIKAWMEIKKYNDEHVLP